MNYGTASSEFLNLFLAKKNQASLRSGVTIDVEFNVILVP
jgi:hypothetical protein